MRVSRRCIVAGRVQGVWYRASTRDKALSLGLEGRAANLPDGRVEVTVTGAPAEVEALCAWLWQGSPYSEVSSVACEDVPLARFDGFRAA